MAKPKDIHVGVYDTGKGEIRVWNVSFTIKGSLKYKDGRVDEASRRAVEKKIQKIVEQLDVPEE